MADLIHGDTELGLTKEEIIAAVVQKELQFKAKLVPTITDVSMFAEPGADKIYFPKLSSFTVANRTEGAAGDASVVNATRDGLDLDQNAYVSWIVDSKTKKQSKLAVEAELAKRAASAHGRYVDGRIIAALTAAAGLSVNGGVPSDITRDSLLSMLEFLESNDADMDMVQIVVSTDQKYKLLKINEFSANDVFGSPVNFTGVIGQLYGHPVIGHNGIGTTQQAFAYEKSGMVVGFQSAPAQDSQPANEYGVGATRDAMDQLFGVAAQQLGEKSLAATKSPLIAKLKD